MRKMSLILALVLALSLILPAVAEQTADPAPAAEETVLTPEAEMMTYGEVEAWGRTLLAMAAQQETRNNPADPASRTEEGYAFEYDFGTLYLSAPVIDENTVLYGAEIVSDAVSGPHGTTVYMFAQEVMNRYALTNTALVGSRQAAVAYDEGEMPGVLCWGCVYRDGQRIEVIEYAALEPRGDDYAFVSVSYTMYENMVLAIRVSGMERTRTESEALTLAAMVEDIRSEASYQQVPSSYKGSELAMFDEADLVFSGLDLHNLRPEQLPMILGEVVSDDWVEDAEGGWIRVVSYTDCELILNYDANKQNPVLDTLSITGDSLEGPRCLRIGDSLTSVRNRFRYGEGDYDEETMIDTFYAAEDAEVPLGQADYSMNGIVVVQYQAAMEDGRIATLMLTFEQMYLTDLMIVLQ